MECIFRHAQPGINSAATLGGMQVTEHIHGKPYATHLLTRQSDSDSPPPADDCSLLPDDDLPISEDDNSLLDNEPPVFEYCWQDP